MSDLSQHTAAILQSLRDGMALPIRPKRASQGKRGFGRITRGEWSFEAIPVDGNESSILGEIERVKERVADLDVPPNSTYSAEDKRIAADALKAAVIALEKARVEIARVQRSELVELSVSAAYDLLDSDVGGSPDTFLADLQGTIDESAKVLRASADIPVNGDPRYEGEAVQWAAKAEHKKCGVFVWYLAPIYTKYTGREPTGSGAGDATPFESFVQLVGMSCGQSLGKHAIARALSNMRNPEDTRKLEGWKSHITPRDMFDGKIEGYIKAAKG